MTITVEFTCGRCGFKWQEPVAISRYDMWQGFTLSRVCPRCHVGNTFSGGGEGLISAMTTTTRTLYRMEGRATPAVNTNFEPPNANFA